MKFLIAVLLNTLFVSHLFGLSEDKIHSVMEIKINKVVSVLQQQELSVDKKANKIFLIMDELFDFSLMSRISLGKSWKRLSSAEKKAFSISFEKRLKESFLDKLGLYNGQKIVFKELKKVKKNRIKLFSEIDSGKEVFTIDYKFYKAKNNQWYIYDVDIVGVSILQTYRKQFQSFLQSKPFNELLKTL
jgi:phospholipid transport system substrate-binding protein